MTKSDPGRKHRYRLQFVPSAWAEWQALDGSVKEPLRKLLKKRLDQPHVPGAALHGELHGFYKIKLRKQGIRLVYGVEDDVLIVMVMAVDKREDDLAYQSARARLGERFPALVGRGRTTRDHLDERADLPTLRNRELHLHVARRLARDPSLRAVAVARLQKLRQVNPHGRVYHDRWAALLEGPLTHLLGTLTEVSEQADALRKESPLTPLMTEEERRRVFESTRAAARRP